MRQWNDGIEVMPVPAPTTPRQPGQVWVVQGDGTGAWMDKLPGAEPLGSVAAHENASNPHGVITVLNFVGGTWTNQPAAVTELFSTVNGRTKFDFSGYSQFRLLVQVNTVGAATSVLFAQYSTDGATWNNLESATTNNIAIATTGLKFGSWANIASGALFDVFIRIAGQNGNGSADPAFGNISIQVK